MEVDLGQLRMPCTCGRAHKIAVRGVWIEEGASRRLYEMLTEGELREFTAPVIVWDENTSEAVEEIMKMWWKSARRSAFPEKVSVRMTGVWRSWRRRFRRKRI